MVQTIILYSSLLLLLTAQIIYLASPVLAIVSNGILLVFFVLLSIYDRYDLYAEDVFALLAAIPALFLILFTNQFAATAYPHAVLDVCLFILSMLYIWSYKKKFSFSLSHVGYFVLALPLGILLAYILKTVGGKPLPVPFDRTTIGVLLYLMAALGSELYFRLLVQDAAIKMTTQLTGIIFVTLLFLLTHYHTNTLMMIYYFFVSLISSLLYMKSRSIIPSILLYAISSICFFIIF